MIHSITNNNEKLPQDNSSITIDAEQLRKLTLEPNSVLVIKAPMKNYDIDSLNQLRDYFKEFFCNVKIAVVYNDITFEIINDDTYRPSRPCAEKENPYGY